MGATVIKLVVLGEIPGIGVQLGYIESLLLASGVVLFAVLNVTLLYQNRKVVRRLLRDVIQLDIDLITI